MRALLTGPVAFVSEPYESGGSGLEPTRSRCVRHLSLVRNESSKCITGMRLIPDVCCWDRCRFRNMRNRYMTNGIQVASNVAKAMMSPVDQVDMTDGTRVQCSRSVSVTKYMYGSLKR